MHRQTKPSKPISAQSPNKTRWHVTKQAQFCQLLMLVSNQTLHTPLLAEVIMIVEIDCPLLLFEHTHKFTNLSILHLRNCNLANVEFVAYLDCPNLSQLGLERNQIAQGRALRKCLFPRFSTLLLEGNPIKQYTFLSQLQLNKTIDNICLYLQDFTGISTDFCLNWVAKLTRAPTKLYCEGENRIANRVLIAMLKRSRSWEQQEMTVYTYKTYGGM